MHKKIIAIISAGAIVAIVGCAHLMNQPSICDQAAADNSYICSQCESLGVRIEDVDLIIQLATLKLDVDKKAAMEFFGEVEKFLMVANSYVELFIFVNEYLKLSSAEALIISNYLKHLNSPDLISEFDRGLLLIHIQNQKKLL